MNKLKLLFFFLMLIYKMSLSLNRIKPVKVIDPELNFNQEYVYSVLKGGDRVSWKPIVSTTYNQSSATFSAPTPNPKIEVCRRIRLVQPVTIDFVGNAPLGQCLLQSQYDAFRCQPLSFNMETLQLDTNNTQHSINMRDTISALLRYHNSEDMINGVMSTTPSMLDQSQQYSDLANSIRNPLASYVDSNNNSDMGRGAFPLSSLTNNVSAGIGVDTTASLTATLCEDLFLSPLIFGTDEQSVGFIGLQTFQLVVNWASDLSRMWCHDNSGGTTLTSITVTLGQPTLLFQYKTPDPLMSIPSYMPYPYYEVQRYPTDLGASIAAGASQIMSSSNIQLNSIPRIMYIYARKRNSDLTFLDTDTFFSIERISINWANNSGLLSSATKRDLYVMSKQNGCNMNWMQWSGEPSYFMSGSTNQAISGPGSVLAVEFGTNLGLPSDESPGLSGTYQLQMEVTIQNRSAAAIFPTLYVVILNEGVFTLENNSAYSQIGVISREDVLNSQKQKGIDYQDLKYMAGAGGKSFFRGFKRALGNIYKGVKKYGPEIKKGVELAAKYGPEAAAVLGLGYDEMGGTYAGGKVFCKTCKQYDYTKHEGKRCPAGSRSTKIRKKKPSTGNPVGRPKKKRAGILLEGGKMISKRDLERALM